MTSTTSSRPISRSDIEAKLREIQGEASTTGESAKSIALIGGAVAVVAVVGLAFAFGRRRGKKKTTIVEVRRV
jgi:LPXTG-motif cell wall-anchored protein